MATTTLMSFAEFERLDEGVDHIELLKGELIRVPPSYAEHMEIVERLFELLKAAVEHLRESAQKVDLGTPTRLSTWTRRYPSTWPTGLRKSGSSIPRNGTPGY